MINVIFNYIFRLTFQVQNNIYQLVIFQIMYLFLLIYEFSFNLRSLLVFCLSSGDIYLSGDIYYVSKLFCVKLFETLGILSAILFPIKSPVPSVVF